MKIYLYDTDTGCYLGEDFASAPCYPEVADSLTGATTVAPPPCAVGQAPVFLPASQEWQVRSIVSLKAHQEK